MLQLSEIQRQITAEILGDGGAGRRRAVAETDTATDNRIDIHRNNFVITLTDALAQVYPVILRLVGSDYFRQVARDFVCRHPPSARTLIQYGGNFPEFLACQPSAAAHPYLSDVGKLEWACHLAFHAPDTTTTDLQRLLDVPADAWPNARVRVSPSLQLVQSNYPIARIWFENQPDREDPSVIELEIGKTFVSVMRPDLDIEVRSHDAAEFKLISLVKSGCRLQEAYDLATESVGPIDLEALLTQWLAAKLIVDINPKNETTL